MANEELAVLIQSGRRDLLLELWQQVERFVRWKDDRLAQKLDGRYGVATEDLYQCGFLALLVAVQSFRVDKERSFIGWFDYSLWTEFAKLCG